MAILFILPLRLKNLFLPRAYCIFNKNCKVDSAFSWDRISSNPKDEKMFTSMGGGTKKIRNLRTTHFSRYNLIQKVAWVDAASNKYTVWKTIADLARLFSLSNRCQKPKVSKGGSTVVQHSADWNVQWLNQWRLLSIATRYKLSRFCSLLPVFTVWVCILLGPTDLQI